MQALMVERGSTEFEILEALCEMPRPVRGMSEAMLLRAFKSARAINTLAADGLIQCRGWNDGPGGVWVPTKKGEALVAGSGAAGK